MAWMMSRVTNNELEYLQLFECPPHFRPFHHHHHTSGLAIDSSAEMHDFDESEVIPIRYIPMIYLCSGHHKAIRCVAFNEHGSLLATGGDDSHLLIWSSATGMLLHDIETHTIVLSLIWVSNDVLVGGSQDGVLISVCITDVCVLFYVEFYHAH
jgi:WD40 repeat protein